MGATPGHWNPLESRGLRPPSGAILFGRHQVEGWLVRWAASLRQTGLKLEAVTLFPELLGGVGLSTVLVLGELDNGKRELFRVAVETAVASRVEPFQVRLVCE
jgi:hypothetical protein